jgi:hypothetical protein
MVDVLYWYKCYMLMYRFGTLIYGICLDDEYLAKSTPLILLYWHILWYMRHLMVVELGSW